MSSMQSTPTNVVPSRGRAFPSETCGRQVVSTLAALGVSRVFCVAGESYLDVLDALIDAPGIDVVTCRHEGSAAFMAIADAKLQGRAGVCLVNRGPGAANAAIGVHSAAQDATPLILVVGDVTLLEMGRLAFQEIDYTRTFSDLAKAVLVLHEASRARELITRAVRIAETGTPGPVVVVLPEDLLSRRVGRATNGEGGPWPESPATPDPGDLAVVAKLVTDAERPLLLAGGRLASQTGRDLLRRGAEQLGMPVVVTNKHQDLLANDHPHYAGHLHLATPPDLYSLLDEADLVVAVGTRLDHVSTAMHRFPNAPIPRQALVHVYPDAAHLGAFHRPRLGFACDSHAFLRDLLNLHTPIPPDRVDWIARLHRAVSSQAAWTAHVATDGVVFGATVAALARVAPDELIVTVDAGNFTSWVHRYFPFSPQRRLLGIASSAMGFGIPAGVAAALRCPGTPVVCFVGDGGFLMNGSELATAVERDIPLLIIVANNGSYGTIRQHQERSFPGRVVATTLNNPDFACLASAYGAGGALVTREDQLETTLRSALRSRRPTVIDVRTSLEWISASQHLARVTRPHSDMEVM